MYSGDIEHFGQIAWEQTVATTLTGSNYCEANAFYTHSFTCLYLTFHHNSDALHKLYAFSIQVTLNILGKLGANCSYSTD